MIWAGAALAGTLTLVGPGRIERPLDRFDHDAPFEAPSDKEAIGDGWFRIRSLGVPYFVYLAEEEEVTVDLGAREVRGSEAVRWQLTGQWDADVLRPADLRQLKKTSKQLAKRMKGAPQRAQELARGRLLMVLAESQRPEIGSTEDWLTRAQEISGWTEATAATPAFADFSLEVGAALRQANDLPASIARVSGVGLSNERALLYGLFAASIDCCVQGAEQARQLRDQLSPWPSLYGRLDALVPTREHTPPPIAGVTFDDTRGQLQLKTQGQVALAFLDTHTSASVLDELVALREVNPDLDVVLVLHGDDEAAFRSTVREHVVDGVIAVLSRDAHDRWYVADTPRFFLVREGSLATGPLPTVAELAEAL